MTATDRHLLQRCWDAEQWLGRAISPQVEDAGDGVTAVLDTRLPEVWDANYIVVANPRLSVGEVVAKADEVLGGLGMEHRTVDFADPARAEELAPGFEELGWETERSVYLVLRGEPDRPPEVEVEETTLAEIRGLRHRLMLEDPFTPKREVADQLLRRDALIGKALRDRWFVAEWAGEPAAACRLMQREGYAQVEDVATLESTRGHGLARAIVLAAVEASRADGDELTAVSADAGDWPQHLYRRLGFEPVGSVAIFRRRPD